MNPQFIYLTISLLAKFTCGFQLNFSIYNNSRLSKLHSEADCMHFICEFDSGMYVFLCQDIFSLINIYCQLICHMCIHGNCSIFSIFH